MVDLAGFEAPAGARAVGRPAAAGRPGPGAGAGPAAAAARRAAVQPRPVAARAHPQRAAPGAGAGGDDRRLGDPRAGRGVRRGRPGGAAQRRPAGAAGAARGALSRAPHAVCRRLSRPRQLARGEARGRTASSRSAMPATPATSPAGRPARAATWRRARRSRRSSGPRGCASPRPRRPAPWLAGWSRGATPARPPSTRSSWRVGGRLLVAEAGRRGAARGSGGGGDAARRAAAAAVRGGSRMTSRARRLAGLGGGAGPHLAGRLPAAPDPARGARRAARADARQLRRVRRARPTSGRRCGAACGSRPPRWPWRGWSACRWPLSSRAWSSPAAGCSAASSPCPSRCRRWSG